MDDAITQRDLPGIGRAYDCAAEDHGKVMVVVHHTGRRDLYVNPGGHEEPVAVALSDDQARRLGGILSGTDFKPAVVAQVEAVIGGLLIDWATVRKDSPGRGQSIAELEIRRRTRMTVAAIVRADHTTIVAPEPDTLVEVGDQLVVIGRPEDWNSFLHLVID